MKKKEKRIIDRQYKSDGNPEVKTIVKISIGVLLLFAFVYFISGILTGNIKLKKEKEEEVKIQYSEILAEQTFKQSPDEYYVLFYSFDGVESSYLTALASGLSSTVYKVDLDKKFNSSYISDKVNTNPKKASDIKVSDPTLIKVKNKKTSKVVVGINNIKKFVTKK